MKLILLLLLLLPVSASPPWPDIPFTEVRAYAWPTDLRTNAVILPGMKPLPGSLRPEGIPLSPQQVTRLQTAVTGRFPEVVQAFCYVPHNAFIFYNADKKPVAYVEICFTCGGYRAAPKGTAKNYDLPALAKLFHELGLPTGT